MLYLIFSRNITRWERFCKFKNERNLTTWLFATFITYHYSIPSFCIKLKLPLNIMLKTISSSPISNNLYYHLPNNLKPLLEFSQEFQLQKVAFSLFKWRITFNWIVNDRICNIKQLCKWLFCWSLLHLSCQAKDSIKL